VISEVPSRMEKESCPKKVTCGLLKGLRAETRIDSVRRYGWLGGRRGDELRVSLMGAGGDASPRFSLSASWSKSFNNFFLNP